MWVSSKRPVSRGCRLPSSDRHTTATTCRSRCTGPGEDHYTNREMAEGLVLSVRTVERHVGHIYAKLGASSRRLATDYARQHGVLTTD